MMSTRFSRTIGLAAAAATLLVGGCSSGTEALTEPPMGGVRLVNASATPVNVAVDGQVVLSAVPVGGVTTRLYMSQGSHQLSFVSASGSSTAIPVAADPAMEHVAVAYSTAGGINGAVLADTGAIVPAGKSKLRVANFANRSGIEIWRTQPDWQTPVHIMTPFAYGATSPYLQSDPGNWEVFVTAAGTTTPKLATTGAINIPSGERRTAILLDSAGVLRFRVLEQ